MSDNQPNLRQLTDEERELLLYATAQLGASIAEFVTALMPAFQAALAQANQLFDALKTAGYFDENGKATRAGDRPSWQSPYGPPASRH